MESVLGWFSVLLLAPFAESVAKCSEVTTFSGKKRGIYLIPFIEWQ